MDTNINFIKFYIIIRVSKITNITKINVSELLLGIIMRLGPMKMRKNI